MVKPRTTPPFLFLMLFGNRFPDEWRNENGVTLQFHYLENGILVLKENNNDFWYFRILTDNVGSVVRVIDSEGTAVVEVSYDAWGKPTVALNQMAYQMAFPRGFGGHEMLTKYRLVNMDGRLYDYRLGRFLSPDNYVQAPDDSQSFNRYTYCLNNPLKYTDPSGELFGIDDLIVISLVGGLSNWAINGFQSGWKGVASFFTGAGTSALSFMAGGYVANAFKTAGIITGAGAGALTGGIIGAGTNTLLGGLNNTINGSNFFDGWKKNAWSGFVNGAISGAISGAESGYWNSKEQGLNMWWGTAVKPGRSAWNFFNNDVSYWINADLPYINIHNQDCAVASMLEADMKLNGNLSYEDIASDLGYVYDSEGTKLSFNSYKDYLKEHFTINGFQTYKGDLEEFMMKHYSSVESSNSVVTCFWKDRQHVDNVRAIRVYPYNPSKDYIKFRQSTFNFRLSNINKVGLTGIIIISR